MADNSDIANALRLAMELEFSKKKNKRKHFDDGGGGGDGGGGDGGGGDGGDGGDGGGWGGDDGSAGDSWGDDGLGGWTGGEDGAGGTGAFGADSWGDDGLGGWTGGEDGAGGTGAFGADSWGDDGLGGWTGAEDAGPAGPEGMADEDAAAMAAAVAASPGLAAALGLTAQDMDLSNVGLQASAPESETYGKTDTQAAPGWFGANLDAGPASFEAGREDSNAALAGYYAGIADAQASRDAAEMQGAPAPEASSPFGGLPGSISENTGLDAGPGTIGGSISADNSGKGEGFVGEYSGPPGNASPEAGAFEYAAEWGAPSPSSPSFTYSEVGLDPAFASPTLGPAPEAPAQEPEAPSAPMTLDISKAFEMPGTPTGTPDTSTTGAPAGTPAGTSTGSPSGTTTGTTEGSVGIGGPSIDGSPDQGPSAPDMTGGGGSLWPPLKRYPDGSYRIDESAFNETGMKRGGAAYVPPNVEQAMDVVRKYVESDKNAKDAVFRLAHVILSKHMSSPHGIKSR
jgi:hypothetical protein